MIVKRLHAKGRSSDAPSHHSSHPLWSSPLFTGSASPVLDSYSGLELSGLGDTLSRNGHGLGTVVVSRLIGSASKVTQN